MKRYILTGAPGAGKTVLIRALERHGCAVVEEAATDVIALAQARGQDEPWRSASFIDDILALQQHRRRRADAWPDERVVFDRSPICTLALCEQLGRTPPPALTDEIERLVGEGVYETRVLFIENLGFVSPTEARRISFEESLGFEAIHRAVYRRYGYELANVAPAPVAQRLAVVHALIGG